MTETNKIIMIPTKPNIALTEMQLPIFKKDTKINKTEDMVLYRKNYYIENKDKYNSYGKIYYQKKKVEKVEKEQQKKQAFEDINIIINDMINNNNINNITEIGLKLKELILIIK